MYEARQNKVPTIRVIDKITKTSMPLFKKNADKTAINRNQVLSLRSQGYGTKWSLGGYQKYSFNGVPWEACTYRKIEIPPRIIPHKGTCTSGIAPWNGILLDAGYEKRNATRLHVINSNFGGRGENDFGNLHPGSQALNHNHLVEAENILKNRLKDSSDEYKTLYYECSFNWNRIQNGKFIEDPDINFSITSSTPGDGKNINGQVTKGSGIKVGNGSFDIPEQKDSSDDD